MTSANGFTDSLLRRCARRGRESQVRFRLAAIAAGCLVLSSGCSTVSYYTQAARGHLDIVSRQTPIQELTAGPVSDAELHRKLTVVEEARRFAAARLGLKPGSHYTRYADLQRDAVVYNVYAAPELSLEPRRWWYPLIGRQSYRGFFAKSAALAYAEELRAEGLDVYVGGVDAYSTLGWFRDPVLNTWIDDDDEEIAALVFHELTHQLVYVPDDTRFNEAYATAVEIAGVRLWLADRHDDALLAEWDNRQRRRDEFVHLVKSTRTRLKSIFEGAASADEMRDRKTAELAAFQTGLKELRQRWKSPKAYSSWTTKPVNNARLNTVSTYHDMVPAFLALLQRVDHDFTRFHAEVKKLGRLPKDRRLSALESASIPETPTRVTGH